MTYSYFPGCTLKNKATDLDFYARKSAEVLGFTLEEIPEWQCCGGEYPLAKDEIATKLSSVRALADAHNSGKDLVTLCSACYNVLKQVNNDISLACGGRTYRKTNLPNCSCSNSTATRTSNNCFPATLNRP